MKRLSVGFSHREESGRRRLQLSALAKGTRLAALAGPKEWLLHGAGPDAGPKAACGTDWRVFGSPEALLPLPLSRRSQGTWQGRARSERGLQRIFRWRLALCRRASSHGDPAEH